YWGAAMSVFHPLWEQPSESDLQKGQRIIALARKLIDDTSSKESDYIEGIATIYDQWDKIDHHTRLLKFENASRKVFEKYPDDPEAAIFYSLALRAAADPADKSFQKQKKAGEILGAMFLKAPDHPGIAHYIIHNFDYPELADLALPAARKYASIAAASAHAQHMPSHIFTRLGLWDEAIQSNINSVASAKCYAENLGIKGHSDEELHGMDYLFYAYLQKADDRKAKEQLEYLKTINDVHPMSFKVLYSFAAIPSRYSLERKDWSGAAGLELSPAGFPWEKFPWERANLNFAKGLGAARSNKIALAKDELEQLRQIHGNLSAASQHYKANLINIQIKINEAWINLAEGHKEKALNLMSEASEMEDATEKHSVTPGELIPARELLADMYMEAGEPAKALVAYEADLKRHANRFNGLYGAAFAAEKSGDIVKANQYYRQLIAGTSPDSDRQELKLARLFVARH
ncbi:MAG TPA: hypothetical protein VK625_13800, partial [Flavitalea sp.]|nr:hypothetical protein [Flavitalea sp.]